MSEVVPSAAKWALAYDDGSEKLEVEYDERGHWKGSVLVRQNGNRDSELPIDEGDLRWLAARLLDAAASLEALHAREIVAKGLPS